MDAVDQSILAVLQREGRITLTHLAAQVGLSPSPCHRRLRALEASGVITGYRARLDTAALGLGLQVCVFVTMAAADRATVSAFEAAVAEVAHVLCAQRLFGDPDYVLQVVARDLSHFQALYDTELATLPGVRHLRSAPVMRTVVQDKPLPL